jgi:hypothetical protein
MANAKLSVLATQMKANAAAIATAVAGGVVTSDITALADMLNTLALNPDLALPAMSQCPPALASTYLQPS